MLEIIKCNLCLLMVSKKQGECMKNVALIKLLKKQISEKHAYLCKYADTLSNDEYEMEKDELSMLKEELEYEETR
jgi:hypothetical protein